MAWLGALVFYLYVAITSIPVSLVCVLSWPFVSGRWRYESVMVPWGWSFMWVLRVFCGLTYEVRGLENLPAPGERVVVLSKHMSAWETFFLPLILPQRMSFVYKESLHWLPFFGWALKSLDMISINRAQGARAYMVFLRKGARFLKDGWWITMFPEGTRVAPGKRIRYKTGGARFAVAQKADVVPVSLTSGWFWPRNSFAKRPGKIVVSIGPVIKSAGRDPVDLSQQVEDWIEDELKRIAPRE
ncbi:MAG: 1-acyl-sn-glycerol-3-phosphate acyltransferase [Duodenibacillus sp.]|nr:1-acyl-sn-glycerol-3-phosphate acyltransferase [Duodenibacillus sp.]